MGQVYTILSEACCNCMSLDTPRIVNHESVLCQGFNDYKPHGGCCSVPPLHPNTPQHTRNQRRKNQWYIPEEKTEADSGEETGNEFTFDHQKICNICGDSTISTKPVGTWNLCDECYHLGGE